MRKKIRQREFGRHRRGPGRGLPRRGVLAPGNTPPCARRGERRVLTLAGDERARDEDRRLWRRAGRVFAERYHAFYFTTPRAVRNALIYVLQNARKHGAWRAFAPDAYSSAPWFDGWNCQIVKGAESRSRLLVRARTWLLSIGWRRHGLIDPLEVPVGAEVYM